ncbi:hypothetical protein FAGAP_942 [Fusarium agapanthi]|uniref:Uncharacterized protein n=1 Tax=Fusarium agapanthi TaxID=1803897 RepID=A0A9P5BK69_9HYPO|nr:hypothetical protein FAGAP_942 [Fusarium agapanthi]
MATEEYTLEDLPEDERHSVWEDTQRKYWITYRNKNEAKNNEVEMEFKLLINEELLNYSHLTRKESQLNTLESYLARELAKVSAERTRTTDEREAQAGRLEHIKQDYHVSRQKRAESQQDFWIKMRAFFRGKMGEDPHTADDRGPESEGIILPEELPELASASDRLATRQESLDSSSEPVHPTVEVQPRPEPMRQPGLRQSQQSQQVEEHISEPSRSSSEQFILIDTPGRVADQELVMQRELQNEMEPRRQNPMESPSLTPHEPIVDLPRGPPNHPSAELDGSAKDHPGSDPVQAPREHEQLCPSMDLCQPRPFTPFNKGFSPQLSRRQRPGSTTPIKPSPSSHSRLVDDDLFQTTAAAVDLPPSAALEVSLSEDNLLYHQKKSDHDPPEDQPAKRQRID